MVLASMSVHILGRNRRASLYRMPEIDDGLQLRLLGGVKVPYVEPVLAVFETSAQQPSIEKDEKH